MKTVLLGLLLGFTFSSIAQTSEPQKYDVRGVIRNERGQVFPGLRLNIKSDKTSTSAYVDVNGGFYAQLPEGDFILSIDDLRADEYRLFLKVGPNHLRPGFMELIVDYDRLVCGGKENPSPSIVKSVKPIYPAAATAVRAGGEVSVSVKIAPDGKVNSATAQSGHPLLRRAAEVTAGQFEFESSKESNERDVRIIFVFLPSQSEKPNIERLSCPYRPFVPGATLVIETTNSGLVNVGSPELFPILCVKSRS